MIQMSDLKDKRDLNNNEIYREKLTAIQYHVTRESGTERPFTGKYNLENRGGSYFCVCCNHLLFTSEMKYESKIS